MSYKNIKCMVLLIRRERIGLSNYSGSGNNKMSDFINYRGGGTTSRS